MFETRHPLPMGKRTITRLSNLEDENGQYRNACHFLPRRTYRVIADASPVGHGAILLQEQQGTLRVTSFASRTLSDVEQRYSQTEKEALALVWACERFSMYLIGRHFHLVTDHKPLEILYSPRSKPPARIERWVLRLQSFNFTIVYKPGKYNIADPLSRLTTTSLSDTAESDQYIKFVASYVTPTSLTPGDIEVESSKDHIVQQVRKAVTTGTKAQAPADYKHIF